MFKYCPACGSDDVVLFEKDPCCCLECTFMWRQDAGRITVTVRLIKAVANLKLHSHNHHRGALA